jgi:hypothetical protein
VEVFEEHRGPVAGQEVHEISNNAAGVQGSSCRSSCTSRCLQCVVLWGGIAGDLVDLLTATGTFAFLEDLHETGRLWDLRNFLIPRLVPRGTALPP